MGKQAVMGLVGFGRRCHQAAGLETTQAGSIYPEEGAKASRTQFILFTMWTFECSQVIEVPFSSSRREQSAELAA